MNTQEILEKLKFNTGVFPREALQEAISRPHEIIPELLDILKYTTQNLEEIAKNLEETGYIQNIFAMFLLAQFREKRAYPLLIEFLSIRGRLIFYVTGDVITEELCRILASVSCGDVGLLPSLIENPKINEYVRSAALDAFLVLMFCGEISREEVVKYFQYLFREGLEKKSSNIWNALAFCSTKIYPKEVYEEIKKAYKENLIEPFYIEIEEVEEALKEGKEKTLSISKQDRYHHLIEDTIKEMENWACFKTKEELDDDFNKRFERLMTESKKHLKEQNKFQSPKKTISLGKGRKQEDSKNAVEEMEAKFSPKISRNRHCPCGSGKKYKKCCLVEKR